MGSNNKYTNEDRLIAYAMYRSKMLEIGFFTITKIAELTGHSADSFQMKVDQFKGIAGPRSKKFGRKENDFGPGLNEWAEADEQIFQQHKNTTTEDLAKRILNEKFKASQGEK